MSYVRPDITSPSHWLPMAMVMARKFERFAGYFYTDINEIPADVLQEAKNFFLIIFDGKGENEKSPKNPEESANIDAIARHAMPQIPETLTQLDLKLKCYADFIDKIGERRKLEKKDEIETAKELFRFFTNLKRFSEDIRSLEMAHGKDYWHRHGIRFVTYVRYI